jgi:hypothetical protein
MKYWLIVNILGADEAGLSDDLMLREIKRPKYIHSNKELAEEELLRLEKHFSGEFVLFEAVATAETVTPFVVSTPPVQRVKYLDPQQQIPMSKGWTKRKAKETPSIR